MQALRSEVEAQGGRAAEVSEVLVAVAEAGWEGEGEGGQMIAIAGGIILAGVVWFVVCGILLVWAQSEHPARNFAIFGAAVVLVLGWVAFGGLR